MEHIKLVVPNENYESQVMSAREDILNLILPIPPTEYQERVVAYIRKANVLFSSLETSLN